MSLKKYPGSPPEIFKLQYAFASDINTIMKVSSFATVIELKEFKSWNDLYATPGSVSFNEKSEDTPSGTLYKRDVVCSFPGIDPLAQDEIFRLNRVPLILLMFYQDGTIRVVGNLEEPVKLLADHESTRRTGFNITFLSQGIERTRFLYPDLQSIPV